MEIYLTLSQTQTIDSSHQATFLYSPEFYDRSLAGDYGGYVDRQSPYGAQPSMIATTTNVPHPAAEEELGAYEDEDVEDFDNDTMNHQSDAIEPLRERHWTLSDVQAAALFGASSSRLHQIRSESNAWIVIYEPEGNGTRRPMSIRGTKAEIEHATKLILETIERHDRKPTTRNNPKHAR